LPLKEFETNENQVELVAQLPANRSNSEIVFEWSFSESFLKPSIASTVASGRIAKHTISIPGDSDSKIYWRVYLPEDRLRPSQSRSINYNPNLSSRTDLPEVVVFADDPPGAIQDGDLFKLKGSFQNITKYSFSDSITVKILQYGSGEAFEKLIKISPLTAYENRNFEFLLPTAKKTEAQKVILNFNYTGLPEAIYSNNIFLLTYSVFPDIIPPALIVSLDDRLIHDNEVVSASPLIGVQVRDENRFLIRSDTTDIEVWLKKDCQNCIESKLSLRNAMITSQLPNNFVLKIRPEYPLATGSYGLRVTARDASQNMAIPYQISFRIQHSPGVTAAGVSPNPSGSFFRFYLEMEGPQASGVWLVTLRDITGKQIKRIETKLHLGRNELFWHPETLTPGVILYQMELLKTDYPISEEAKPGMRGKVIWVH
jgi:hypothetical protein